MSLKNFHLVFIASSSGLMAFLVYWGVGQTLAGEGQTGVAAAGAVGLAGALAYLAWFLRAYRRLA